MLVDGAADEVALLVEELVRFNAAAVPLRESA